MLPITMICKAFIVHPAAVGRGPDQITDPASAESKIKDQNKG